MDTQRIVPVLRMFSVEKAEEFYFGFMGFVADWHHRFEADAPLYMQVSRSGILLHLSEHHGDASPGATVFIEIRGIEALRDELARRRYRYARPGIVEQPWGFAEMTVTDPFGNRLRFAERRAGGRD